MVEHPNITLNPNRPKHDAAKKVPNFDFLTIVLRNPFPREDLFLVEAITFAHGNPTTSAHDEGHPLPCLTCLDAIPKLSLN